MMDVELVNDGPVTIIVDRNNMKKDLPHNLEGPFFVLSLASV